MKYALSIFAVGGLLLTSLSFAKPAEATFSFNPCRFVPQLCNINPSVTPTPSVSPSVSPTPSVTPNPTDAPHQDNWQLGGPAPRPECKKIDFAPTVVWVSSDGKSYTWTKVSDQIHFYWVEYTVNGKVYTVVANEESYTFGENVQSIRVAGLDDEGGCRGAFSTWSSKSLSAGVK